ncbi:MAG: S-layer homology domain-containing protein, partial [Clostridia bacterium]|nr:S-layer homology domain-containing protein [Clostridia bacterium]
EKDDEKQNSVYFFDDMASAIWAQDMVHTLVGKGVISQNAERAFRPMDPVTREEFVKMIVTVIGSHNQDAVSSLSDVDASHWATSYIATAQELGIVQGNADGSFGLGTNITRQDMAVMIYRTFAMLGIDLSEGTAAFDDSNEISDYAKTAVSALEKQGIINGMGDNTFAPAANATRAQAAKVIYVMMEVLGV